MNTLLNIIGLGFFIGTFFTHDLSAQMVSTYFCFPGDREFDAEVYDETGTPSPDQMELVERTMEEQLDIISIEKGAKRKIALYIHDGMEILDFAGPTEVFTFAGFDVYTVGLTKDPIVSQGIVKITPQYTIDDCPKPDIIAVFGGNGVHASQNPKVLEWIRDQQSSSELLFSVCTGAFFYARAGLLDGKKATTFHDAIESLQKVAPEADIVEGVKFVDEGKIITTAGVSSGIDGALYVVQKYMGKEKAMQTAAYMEYDCWEAK